MIHEDMAVAAISKKRAAEFSNISRCFHPARGLRIEIPQFLQLRYCSSVRQLNAHGSCHIQRYPPVSLLP